jgi:hypothetical protein
MIAVDWGSVEETFIIWRFENMWLLSEFQAAHSLSSKMISSKAYPIDIIIDIRRLHFQSRFLHAALEIHRQQSPKNIGKTIILRQNDFMQNIFRLLDNFYPNFSKDFIFTDSVDVAYTLVLPAA